MPLFALDVQRAGRPGQPGANGSAGSALRGTVPTRVACLLTAIGHLTRSVAVIVGWNVQM
jgi:hypothetical protein